MDNSVFRSLIFPAVGWYSGTTIQQHLAALLKFQWRPIKDLEELQNKNTRSLVRHAYNNVPIITGFFQRRRIHQMKDREKDILSYQRYTPVCRKIQVL